MACLAEGYRIAVSTVRLMEAQRIIHQNDWRQNMVGCWVGWATFHAHK